MGKDRLSSSKENPRTLADQLKPEVVAKLKGLAKEKVSSPGQGRPAPRSSPQKPQAQKPSKTQSPAEEMLRAAARKIRQGQKSADWQPVIKEEKKAGLPHDESHKKPQGYYGKTSADKVTASTREVRSRSPVGKDVRAGSRAPRDSSTRGLSRADIVIGFDLGTSCSKMILRDPNRRRALAVPFRPDRPSLESYLQPTIAFVSPSGTVSLQDPGNCHKCGDFKRLLMEDPAHVLYSDNLSGLEIGAQEVATCYIALMLREVRNWFEQTQRNIYHGQEIIWQLNLGIPVKNYDDERIKRTFHCIAKAGWYISERDRPIDMGSARDALNMTALRRFNPGIDPAYINVVPEVAAEVAGYALSPLREEGLHLLVDVGAGTVDLSTFILHSRDGEGRYPFMAADVRPLGCYILHKRRFVAMNQAFQELIKHMDGKQNPMAPLPESLSSYLPSQEEVEKKWLEVLRKSDEEHKTECMTVVGEVIRHTKNKRDPRSNTWRTTLPVFMCGGGSKLAFYQEAMKEKAEQLRNIYRDWHGFNF